MVADSRPPTCSAPRGEILARLLTEGEIEHSIRGRHCRLLLSDVLDHRDRARRVRRETIDELAAAGEEAGLSEATAPPRHTR